MGAFSLLLKKGEMERSPSTGPFPLLWDEEYVFHWFLASVEQIQASLPGTLATRNRLFPPFGLFLSAVADGGFCSILSGITEARRKSRGLTGLCSSSLKVLQQPSSPRLPVPVCGV